MHVILFIQEKIIQYKMTSDMNSNTTLKTKDFDTIKIKHLNDTTL